MGVPKMLWSCLMGGTVPLASTSSGVMLCSVGVSTMSLLVTGGFRDSGATILVLGAGYTLDWGMGKCLGGLVTSSWEEPRNSLNWPGFSVGF